jgi:hypothetical protein
MLTWHDITGLAACTIGGGLVGYTLAMARHHWRARNYHIVWDDDRVAHIVRNRR